MTTMTELPVVANVDQLNELAAGSVVHLRGMRKPIYREYDGVWMSTHVTGKPVEDYIDQDDCYPGQVIFRSEPML